MANNKNNAPQFELLRSEAQGLGIEFYPWISGSPRTSTWQFGAKALVNGVHAFINSPRFASQPARRNTSCRSSIRTANVLARRLMSIGPGHYEGYQGAGQCRTNPRKCPARLHEFRFKLRASEGVCYCTGNSGSWQVPPLATSSIAISSPRRRLAGPDGRRRLLARLAVASV